MNHDNKELVIITNGHPLNEISIKSLVGYLEANNVSCCSIYLNVDSNLSDDVVEQIFELCKNAKLVGFSAVSNDVDRYLPVVNKLKNINIPIIWGGIHPTAMPQKTLDLVDFVCIGEGEETILRLYEEIISGRNNFSSVPNLGYKKDGQPVLPTIYWSAEDLDKLPYPDYKFLDSYMLQNGKLLKIPFSIEERKKFFGMAFFLYYASRGCPNNCTYCSNSLYHQLSKKTKVKWFRTASASRVIEEIRHHAKYMPIEFFWFNDDDFLARSEEELIQITNFVKKELNVPFNVNATPNVITPKKMKILANNGLRQIAFGVQTGSDRILKGLYKRYVSSDKIRKTGKLISEYYKKGVMIDCSWILDNPYEDLTDLRETVKLFYDLPKPINLTLCSLAFFPDTQLTLKALEDKVITKDQITIKKDILATLNLNFPYMMILCYYKLKLPRSIIDYMLQDEIFIAEDAKYARLLMANYFTNPKIKQIGENYLFKYKNRLDYNLLRFKAGKDTALFWVTLKIIFDNYKNPEKIITDDLNNVKTLIYPNGLEITFDKNHIISWKEKDQNSETFEKVVLESCLVSKVFHTSNAGKTTFKSFIKYPRRIIKSFFR